MQKNRNWFVSKTTTLCKTDSKRTCA